MVVLMQGGTSIKGQLISAKNSTYCIWLLCLENQVPRAHLICRAQNNVTLNSVYSPFGSQFHRTTGWKYLSSTETELFWKELHLDFLLPTR